MLSFDNTALISLYSLFKGHCAVIAPLIKNQTCFVTRLTYFKALRQKLSVTHWFIIIYI